MKVAYLTNSQLITNVLIVPSVVAVKILSPDVWMAMIAPS